MSEQSLDDAPATHLFPGESLEYRQARNRLLAEERKLKAASARVAGLRSQLPLGGEAPRYELVEVDAAGVSRVRGLSDLFAPGRDSLLVLSLVCPPNEPEPDAASVSVVDALQSQAVHLLTRCNLAVVGRAPAALLSGFGRHRGWTRLRLLSSTGTRFGADYRAEAPDGRPLPACNVFVKRDGRVRHFWAAELMLDEAAGSPRHLDLLWPLWNYLDLLPDGRQDFLPRHDYSGGLRDTLVSHRG